MVLPSLSQVFLAGCGTKEQNWLCLQCGAVNCGRYVNGHAKQHAEQAVHQLCMSCDVYSVYWYAIILIVNLF